jgi:hypothetical protein
MTKRHTFRGFDDPIEIFRAGKHTDSQGRTQSWTEDDLDQMITNHTDSTAAPAVIGHPETNDPAYGWIERLERKGKSLFAKFKDVAPEFASAVEKGHYRKRSISVGKTPNGWRLLHVGWLGAKAPALDLAPMNYSVPDDVEQVCDFEMADTYTPSVLARLLRRFREWVIERDGTETADRILPDWEIESLQEHTNSLRRQNSQTTESDAEPAFARFEKPDGDDAVKNFSQADLDQARESAKAEAKREYEQQQQSLQSQLDQERSARFKSEFESELGKLQDEGRLTPAQAAGALEFMQSLASEPSQFEFAAADGKQTTKSDQLSWFRNFIASLPKQVDIGRRQDDPDTAQPTRSSFSAPSGTTVDADRLAMHERALEYARTHKVSYSAAVIAVEQEG